MFAPIGDITFTATGIGSHIDGIEVDGKLLVDGTAVWNTDQVWSEGGSFGRYVESDVSTLFNGDLSNGPSLTANKESVYTCKWCNLF